MKLYLKRDGYGTYLYYTGKCYRVCNVIEEKHYLFYYLYQVGDFFYHITQGWWWRNRVVYPIHKTYYEYRFELMNYLERKGLIKYEETV